MDDNDTICPLCCEELDMSDRQFFPCKCGYQVCMWCWHRIREQETGLCPACRTPYGDDPHEFSAVDMQEVLKANKEKAAAEKRDRERLRQQQPLVANSYTSVSSWNHGGPGTDGPGVTVGFADGDGGFSSAPRIALEPPKDRNVLANMRVIRRNLVYAVGFPLSIATEDGLKKPEYLGQYGKISKIVLNRNHTAGTDSRRASASAYITFVHKEDALACIIALDGFYIDGRNIRASYGTSKYCSSFIKNIKCSNPDCTYLHSMGEAEDTFSKQEIQAGYVTSGRDVLARQQQMAAALANLNCRKKVGGGGPSGTGKATSNPIFPPPTFEEPFRNQQSNNTNPHSAAQFPPVHQHQQLSRSVSSNSAGFPAVVAAGPLNNARRSHSLSAVESLQSTDFDDDILECDEVNNPTFTSNEYNYISHPQSNMSNEEVAETRNSSFNANAPNNSTTAASIVATGMHASTKMVPPSSSLTALTPLKRTSSLTSTTSTNNSIGALGLTKSSGSTSTPNQSAQDILSNTIVSKPEDDSAIKSNYRRNGNNVSPSSSISSNGPITYDPNKFISLHESVGNTSSIGGSVIGAIGSNSFHLFPASSISFNQVEHTSSNRSTMPSFDSTPYSGSSLGGLGPMPINSTLINNSILPDARLHSLSSGDAEMSLSKGVGGSFVGNSGRISPCTALTREDSMSMHNSNTVIGPPTQQSRSNNSGVIGGGRTLIGGATLSGAAPTSSSGLTNGNFLNLGNSTSSGSSILASMLGIELPTGSGSLRDSIWDSSSLSTKTQVQAPLPPPPIGSGIKSGDVILGRGFPVSNPNLNPSSTIEGHRNSSDIALLQSLLPGVRITSGSVYQPTSNVQSMSTYTMGHNASSSIDRSIPGNAFPLHPPYTKASQPMQSNIHDQWGEMFVTSLHSTPLSSAGGNAPMVSQNQSQQYPNGPSTNIW